MRTKLSIPSKQLSVLRRVDFMQWHDCRRSPQTISALINKGLITDGGWNPARNRRKLALTPAGQETLERVEAEIARAKNDPYRLNKWEMELLGYMAVREVNWHERPASRKRLVELGLAEPIAADERRFMATGIGLDHWYNKTIKNM